MLRNQIALASQDHGHSNAYSLRLSIHSYMVTPAHCCGGKFDSQVKQVTPPLARSGAHSSMSIMLRPLLEEGLCAPLLLRRSRGAAVKTTPLFSFITSPVTSGYIVAMQSMVHMLPIVRAQGNMVRECVVGNRRSEVDVVAVVPVDSASNSPQN